MPVKLGSKLPQEGHEARIEIVPLIDIMFFLLAAFMLVSLSMVHMRGVRVNLPTATTATPEVSQRDLLTVSVDAAGGAFLDKRPVTDAELLRDLSAAKRANANVRVVLSGDRDTRHGAVVRVLDLARAAGIDKVAMETRLAEGASVTGDGDGTSEPAGTP